MNIELKTGEDEFVTLTPKLKEEQEGNHIYELLDEHRVAWMELELKNNSFQILKLTPRIKEPGTDLMAKLDALFIEFIDRKYQFY